MKPSSLLIAALAAAAITSTHAAKPPQVGDIITLQVQALACFDLENSKELERRRATDGLSAALHFVDRHPLPDNPGPGDRDVHQCLQPLWSKRHDVPSQKGLRLDERRADPVLY
jgi:hypothetical protein